MYLNLLLGFTVLLLAAAVLYCCWLLQSCCTVLHYCALLKLRLLLYGILLLFRGWPVVSLRLCRQGKNKVAKFH